MTNRKQRRATETRAKSGHNKTGQTHQTPGAGASPPVENPTSEEIGLLVTLFNQGRYIEGEAIARQQIKRFPQHGFFWKVLGLMIKSQGRIMESLEAMQKAATLLPMDAEAHFNLGITLNDLGRLNEAELSYRRALEIKPDYVEAQSNLGNIFKTLGRLNEAEACYRRALELKPDCALPHSNLGVILRDLGRLNEAESSFRRALEINPDYAEAHYNLGNTLMDLDRMNEAEACFRRAVEIKPDYAEAHYNLGKAFNALGHQNEAEASYLRALEIKPGYVEAHYNLGITLMDLGRQREAEACYLRALEIKPDYVEAHTNLGITLMGLGRMREAEACYRRAVEINPDYVEAYTNLGNTLKDLGRQHEAEACYRRALEIKPDYAMAHSNLLFTLNYAASHPPSYLLEEARAWETGCISETDRRVAHARGFSRPTLTGRRLRVGYVSADFRQHAVSYFVEQVFAHHDAARLEVFAYSASATRDAVTERIEALVEHWVPVIGLSDQKLRDRIEADEIDVLIDLSGHTAQNRLGVFALRAAPVQAHWLGYFASTGLTEMDYWIGDPILTPPETDNHFSETVWRLPRTWVCYEGKVEAPESCWQPTADGTLWLGSFNNLPKLTPATFALWAQVLHKLPEAKLLLKTKGLTEERNRQRIMDTMANHGIGNERIELQDSRITVDWASHMAYYDRLDIALDPVGGLAGGTTTCDALWMGVPVVSMAGDRMASRMTASMLDAIGRPEWLAESEEEYVAKVTELAHDVAGREVMRVSQRERMASSPLCDAKRLAGKLEDAYGGMFERWRTNMQKTV
ncbi:MAG: tetratricopeptide repeat protein [Desulfuromonadaceae bacterium]|nr:tetratricopeptide repeat protein [Desulfuromonadaceae bacterium]